MVFMRRLFMTCCLLTALLLGGPVTASPADIAGTWLSGDGDGLIEIRVDGAAIAGNILGSATPDPQRPKTDTLNPDPTLRSRPLVGLDIFSGFTYDGDGKWSGGFIYDPNSGKTYRGKLRLVDTNTLEVRGFIGISLIGRTETWTRHSD
jgi:uncharacterized protein (DUF2147 family)